MKKLERQKIGIKLFFLLLLSIFFNLSFILKPVYAEEIEMEPSLENFYTDLDGEWDFFSEELLSLVEIKDNEMLDKKEKVNLPASFFNA